MSGVDGDVVGGASVGPCCLRDDEMRVLERAGWLRQKSESVSKLTQTYTNLPLQSLTKSRQGKTVL